MINITFKPETLELKLDGHANYEESGKDIVCSAVSTLFYTLGNALFQSEEMLTEPPTFNEEKGFLCCTPKEEYKGNITRTYWTILVGLEMVAENYPQNVTFKVGG